MNFNLIKFVALHRKEETYRYPVKETLKSMLAMGWNIERTKEGEAMFQQRETEKQRKISESSQVIIDCRRAFISLYVCQQIKVLAHCVASSLLYRVSLFQPHKIWKMLFYQENYRQV